MNFNSSVIFFYLLAKLILVNAIFGGEDAMPHIAPFLVNIRFAEAPERVQCGGVIITKNIILTASNCISTDLVIFAGDHKVNTDEGTEQIRTNVQIVKHPDNLDGNPFKPNNFAIIFVNKDFEFNEFVQPISLPEIDECFIGIVIGYGWGQNDTETLPDVLQKFEMPIIKRDVCKENSATEFKLTALNICTWAEDKLMAMHYDDQGGPIIQFDDLDVPYLVGIMSFPALPGDPRAGPSIHGNVAAVRDFIDETIRDFSK